MLQESNIPQSWKDTLAEIQKVCPSAVIAGGALRDLDHGASVKDLDIFIESGGDEESAALCSKLGAIAPEGYEDTDEEDTRVYPQSMKEVSLVADYPATIRIPVQLIFCDWKTRSIHKRFDYGICQIVFDGKILSHSKAYATDKSSKTMTLVRCENEWMLRASIKRFARLRPKYPEHDWSLGCKLNFGVDNAQFMSV